MSVCIFALPVALAMAVVMGPENYEKWVQSMQVKIPTNFKTRKELITTVKKAGYDAEETMIGLKTHIQNNGTFFTWELEGNQWVAVFSKYELSEVVQAFIADLEAKAGRMIFETEQHMNQIKVIPTKQFPTNFVDGELLKKTLVDYGAQITVETQQRLVCSISGINLKFTRANENSTYAVEVENTADLNQIFTHIALLDEDYKRNIQDITYQKIKERLASRNMDIENEQILEDNSIVLTISIGANA